MANRSSKELPKSLIIIFTVAILIELIVLLEFPLTSREALLSKNIPAFEFDQPLVVLYEGGPKHWSTAYWASWGQKQNLKGNQLEVSLPWAAEGVTVTKSCNVSCYITKNQDLVPIADAVVMEIINHQKSNGNQPMIWPQKGKPISGAEQLWGSFYYEPPSKYTTFLENPDISSKFQFNLTPHQDSTLPVTLICPWGKSFNDYLAPPPTKRSGVSVCDFSGLIPGEYKPLFAEFRKHVDVDSFHGPYKNKEAPQPFHLPSQIQQIGKYKFAIIVEHSLEKDWVGPEFSQALLAGAIPIYLGAPNIDDFLPGPNSIIKVADFENGQQLADHVNKLLNDEKEYMKYFEWKKAGLLPSFKTHLENCVHLAECRICNHVLQEQQKQKRSN